jgi:type I restriction-modification system DNA methylase subunit
MFYLCLQKDNIINNVPLKIKEASIVKEEQITKEFYKDYSLFKRELYRDLVKNNVKRLKLESSLRAESKQPQEELSEEQKAELIQLDKNVKLTLFKKSQKLIDRFLFIFFAEDRGLLPANSTELILEKWKADIDFGDERPLYNLFKQYFIFLDKGRQGTKSRGEIYAYNGGLFKEDTLLDGLLIDNALLYKHTHKLAGYDFESQVDVNILGHIFENSLNEIESVNAEIEGADFDKQTSKRKKDGVFYTPKYITKYIVENTVGKLCTEKKAELGIKEEEYFKGRKNRKDETIKKLVAILDNYRDWLLQLTICDPACGSGAFLNQALDFLIKEHTYIDELKTKVLGGGLQFSDIENTILENNIFGVDLNEESVEIAKLSLWLRTAQPRRKLNDLSSNIKCGNSLIDSKAVAGDKAFNWETQFPKVFEKGGFDVVIGNPPYVNLYNMKVTDRVYFENSSNFQTTYLKYDLYVLFIEKGIQLLKNEGLISFIIPSVILSIPYGKLLREKIVKDFYLDRIVDFTGFKVFSDAMVESCILSIEKSKKSNNQILVQKPLSNIYDFEQNSSFISQKTFLTTEGFQFRIDLDANSLKIIHKIKQSSVPLGSVYYVSKGIVAYSKIDKRKKEDFLFSSKLGENYKKYLEGRDVNRYIVNFDNKFLAYDEKIMSRPTFPQLHENNKILVRAISGGLNATYDTEGFYIDQKLIICSKRSVISPYLKESKKPKIVISNRIEQIDDFSILGVLNSKISEFYYSKMLKGGVSVLPEDIRQFPICTSFIENNKLKDVVKAHLLNNKSFNEKKNKFIKYINSQYSLQKLSRKLQNWHELEFGDFIKELNKAVKTSNKQRLKENLQEVPTLTKKDEFEWLDLFEENKRKAQALQTQITQTNKEIDAMVYELYGLTEDEIQIVENS